MIKIFLALSILWDLLLILLLGGFLIFGHTDGNPHSGLITLILISVIGAYNLKEILQKKKQARIIQSITLIVLAAAIMLIILKDPSNTLGLFQIIIHLPILILLITTLTTASYLLLSKKAKSYFTK